MSQKVSIADVLILPVEERIRLVEEIWDSIAAVPEAIAITEAQRQELDARLEAHRQNSSEGTPWSEVKDRLIRRR